MKTKSMSPLKTTVAFSLLIVATQFAFVNASGAASHQCSTQYCSSSDGSSGTKTGGGTPQVYVGEVGVYYWAFGGSGTESCNDGFPDYSCFIASAATASNNLANSGGGLGTQFYWFSGGPHSSLAAGYTPYCWGWAQGAAAVSNYEDSYLSYGSWADLMFMDIEGETGAGWLQGTSTTNQSNDRAVFNGFSDFIAGRTSAQPGSCSGHNPYTFQYGVYSSPTYWSFNFASSPSGACGQNGGTYGTLANTLIWTDQTQQSSESNPGNFSHACWFASSNYDMGFQFYQGPDYDLFYEPTDMPALGFYWGS